MAGHRFDTPGGVDHEAGESFLARWHEWHALRARSNIADLRKLGARGEIPYANPADEPVPASATTTAVPWEGFPASVTTRWGRGPTALEQAESKGYDDVAAAGAVDETGGEHDCKVRHRQDEYLEWEDLRDGSGRLAAVTFVCEGYDYWSELFSAEPGYVANEFSTSTGRLVHQDELRAPADLYYRDGDGNRLGEPFVEAGHYNYRNQVNQGPGIRHLSHDANSLGAEINLAVTSCLPRRDQDRKPVPADPQRLLCCTRGGDPNRSSDPRIAAGAYGLVTTKKQRFTLADPVGLYVRDFDLNGLEIPGQGQPPEEICDVQRGTGDPHASDTASNRILRMRIAPPAGATWALSDLRLADGTPLTRGAQLAHLVGMHLLVDHWDANSVPEAVDCRAGCCRNSDGLLFPYRPGQRCPDGTVDAFPELVRSAGEAVIDPAVTSRLARR
jgi:hypothetical protein